jgi:two-component system phosphate regulon sensor histidine kinase PhoR
VENPRLKRIYLVPLPALVIAACVIGYYTFLTARQFELLGEQSIAESSLLLLQDKVERIEQQIITADNQAFGAIDLDDEASVQEWKLHAEEISPSIRALLVLDADRHIVGYAARANADDQRVFRRLFMTRMLQDLELDGLEQNRLKHLHRSYGGRNYLISYMAVIHRGKRYAFVAHHDTGYLVRSVFAEVLRNEPGQPTQNVIDQDNRRVFGPSLSEVADYVVGRRFPTTLYTWRLQAAPTTAPLLKEKRHSSRVNQVALITLSLAIMLVAVGFILYAADKERRLADMKSDFIANVSHELKTPLSVIRMFGEMMLTKRMGDESKQQEYLEIICSESERLSGLIENVLDFAALDRGKRRYEMRNCDVLEIAQRAIDTLHYRFERENIAVRLQHTGEPAHGSLDEQAILLVIINLLDNAVKYGGGNAIDLLVETHNNEILVKVRDHGPGIPEADRKRVFERFYRGKSSLRTRGSGIGLAIVKRIAEEHHGRAFAESAIDGGAIVGFAIPRRNPTREMPRLDASPVAAASSHSAPALRGGASSYDTAPGVRGGASGDTAPALRGGASSDTAPALRGGASPAAAATIDSDKPVDIVARNG